MFFVGQGNDTHQLILNKNSNVVLGGYKFKTKYKILAHSDGDVVLHSLANAILGALTLGDIGDYFSDKLKKNKNLNSVHILNFVINKLNKMNYELINVDMTIICENIFLAKIKNKIKQSLMKLLNVKLINVKATRFEEPSDLISCQTIVLIKGGKNNE